jgi:hypothetical protein
VHLQSFMSGSSACSVPSAGRRLALLVRVSGAPLAAALLTIFPRPVPAQALPTRPHVFVRQIRIDSILLAFGVDSARVRAAVLGAVRAARRLAPEVTKDVPSLDIDVTVPRPLSGGIFDPRGFVRVEVGRNLLEEDRARRLVWEGMVDLQPLPTWREFSRGVLAAVVAAVNKYLLAGLERA